MKATLPIDLKASIPSEAQRLLLDAYEKLFHYARAGTCYLCSRLQGDRAESASARLGVQELGH